MNNFSFQLLKNSLNLSLFIKYFYNYCKTNKEKSMEMFPPLLYKPTDIFAQQCLESKKVGKRFQFQRRRQGFTHLEVITLWCTTVQHKEGFFFLIPMIKRQVFLVVESPLAPNCAHGKKQMQAVCQRIQPLFAVRK